MKKNGFYKSIILVWLVMNACLVYGQVGFKQVAVLNPVDAKGNVNDGIKLLLRSKVTTAIMTTPGYGVYDRLDLSKYCLNMSFREQEWWTIIKFVRLVRWEAFPISSS
ncbi:MAG: hypothetical protein NC048_05270 [Bacteroides sp.]|nr:hypothetical protein [Ruminococcus flavefaciens]MCM1554887.1 hypothetical protein [Bacteroides sp.]